jgi:hypothetical protein
VSRCLTHVQVIDVDLRSDCRRRSASGNEGLAAPD